MAHPVGAFEVESIRSELADIGQSLRSSSRRRSSGALGNSSFRSSIDALDDGFVQQWAKIERLPTYERSRAFLFDKCSDENADVKEKRVIDVKQLEPSHRHLFVERLIKHIEADNLRLLQKIKSRIDKVGIKLPTVEVRYRNLFVEASCKIADGKPLPTLWNSLKGTLSLLGVQSQEAKISIIQNVNGVLQPGRDRELYFVQGGAPKISKKIRWVQIKFFGIPSSPYWLKKKMKFEESG